MPSEKELTPERPLLDWVLEKFPDTSRRGAKQWIETGRVSVDGVVYRRPHENMARPERLALARHDDVAPLEKPPRLHPQLTLIYLDGDLAVVSKQAGLLSVPTPQARNRQSALSILADALCKSGPAGKKFGPFRGRRPQTVHRIDQYTSGLFCMAMNPGARRELIRRLQEGKIERRYIAYVDGKPASPAGTWRHWLKLNPGELTPELLDSSRRKPKEDARTREAVTHYEVLEEFKQGERTLSKLRLRLETGLKHQIRVQAAAEGMPLIGDRTYHPGYADDGTPPVPCARQALHAESLELDHPRRHGVHLKWTAPLPEDLRHLESLLRQKPNKA